MSENIDNNGRSRTWLWVLLGGGCFFVFLLAVFTLVYLAVKGDRDSAAYSAFGDRVGVVELKGVILDPEEFIKNLNRFAEDSSIKAIVIHVNSPGGGAAASQEIFEAVKAAKRDHKKRIVAVIETVGASGAYYVSTGTDKIYSNGSSIVGSIGVIAQYVNYGDLLRWAKLKDVTLKAGELKDAGSPTREMTPQEREYLQSLINDMHGQFIRAVAEGRKMKVEEIQALASGRVWTGQQAQPLKLIDQIATFDEAVKDTAKAVGIKGKPILVRPPEDRTSVLDVFFGDARAYLPTRGELMQTHPGFYYLWK